MLPRASVVAFLLAVIVTSLSAAPCKKGEEAALPLPSTIAPEDLAKYEQQILDWLKAGSYQC